MFYDNNTQETWNDAKYLGGLEELEAARPKSNKRVWQLYNLFSELRRETAENCKIKKAEIEQSAKALEYETDKAVQVIRSADDHYFKLCADKIKRMNQK